MAENADGSIVLKVTVDKDDFAKQLKDISNVTTKINKQNELNLLSEQKIQQAVEKTTQAKLKTQILQDKEAESASKVSQATARAAEAEERRRQASARTFEQKISEHYKELQAEEQILQAKEKTRQAEEKTKQAIEKTNREAQKTRDYLDKSKKSANTFNKAVGNLKNSFISLAKYAALAFGIREFARFSNEASEVASKQESNLLRLSQIYGKAGESVYDFVEANAASIGMSKAAAYEAASSYGNLFSAFADGAENAKLTNAMLNQTAVIATNTGRTFDEVFEKIQSGLFGNTRAIDDLGVYVNVATLETEEAFKVIANGRPWAQLTGNEQKQILTLSILSQSQEQYGNTVLQSTSLIRSRFNAAFEDFKATWGQVVNKILMPILEVATRILNTLTEGLKIIANLTGKQIEFSDKNALSIGNQVDNQNELNDAMKQTEKEQKKLLARFDDLEILSAGTADNVANIGENTGTAGGTKDFDYDIPTIDKDEYISGLEVIAKELVGWALVGLGIVMIFSGHPIIGAGMVAAGYTLSTGATEEAKNLDEETKEKLKTIGTVTGLAAVGLGIILLFIPGCWAWGLGLIGMGAVALKNTLELEEDGEKKNDLKELLVNILEIAGAAAVMLGVILLFVPSCWAIGLKLIALGIVSLYAAQALSGGEIKGALTTFCEQHYEEIIYVSAIAIIVGIVLIFTPETLFIGLALAAAGATALLTATYLTEKDLYTELVNFCNAHYEEITGVAVIGIFLGIIFLFLPDTFWVGLGFLAASFSILQVQSNLTEKPIQDAIKEFCDKHWEALVGIGAAALILGFILLFIPGAQLAGAGLLAAGFTIITATVNFSSEQIAKDIGDMVNEVKNWITESKIASFALGMILLFIPGCQGFAFKLLGDTAKSIFGEEGKLDSSSFKKDFEIQLSDIYNVADNEVRRINKKLAEIEIPSSTKTKYSFSSSSSSSSSASGTLGSRTLNIPALARGAVIPANKSFLAVLGDQKQGTNIEAPAQLIKQMAMEAIIESNSAQGGQTTKEEHYYLNETELMSIVYKLFKGGERLKGNSLIT